MYIYCLLITFHPFYSAHYSPSKLAAVIAIFYKIQLVFFKNYLNTDNGRYPTKKLKSNSLPPWDFYRDQLLTVTDENSIANRNSIDKHRASPLDSLWTITQEFYCGYSLESLLSELPTLCTALAQGYAHGQKFGEDTDAYRSLPLFHRENFCYVARRNFVRDYELISERLDFLKNSCLIKSPF